MKDISLYRICAAVDPKAIDKMISVHSSPSPFVRRHIVGGENRTLISVKTPLRLCRTGTCRKLSAERPQIVVALFERQLVLLLK